eukprot:g4457.t1
MRKKEKLESLPPNDIKQPLPQEKVIPLSPKKKKPLSPKKKRLRALANTFKKSYDDRKLPLRFESDQSGRRLRWTTGFHNLDFHYFLPLFVSGISIDSDPYTFVAVEGAFQMIEEGGKVIQGVIPDLVQPMKALLYKREEKSSFIVLRLLQELASSDMEVSLSLVKHFREILPIFNIMRQKSWKSNGVYVADAVEETLELLEMHFVHRVHSANEPSEASNIHLEDEREHSAPVLSIVAVFCDSVAETAIPVDALAARIRVLKDVSDAKYHQ